MKSKVMLFDKPTSSLDPEKVKEVLDVMKDLAKEGMTMVVVTEKINFARDIADRVIFLDEGKLVDEGASKDIFYNPKKRTQAFLEDML